MSSHTTYTHWFDVKDYTSVTVTAKTVDTSTTPYTSPVTLIWGQGTDDQPPYDAGLQGDGGDEVRDMVAQDQMPAMAATDIQTRQYDTRSRWVMFKTEKPMDMSQVILSYQFKKAPTELKIRDDSVPSSGNSIMNVTQNAAHLLLTDSSGNPIDTTHDNTVSANVNALYVHPADSSGNSLDTVGASASQTLAISIRDASNNAIDTTGDVQNLHIMNPDTESFPSTDILFLLSRGYGMGKPTTGNHPRIRHAVAFIRDFVSQINTYKGNYTNCRVTIASYGRLDISTNQTINQTYTHGAGPEPSDRTIIPGVIEYQSSGSNVNPANIYQHLINDIGAAHTLTAPVDACGAHHVHTINVSGTSTGSNGWDTNGNTEISKMVPGNNIYTTVKNLFDASVGNISPLYLSYANIGVSFETQNVAKPVVIALTDGSFGDYGTTEDGDGIFTYSASEGVQEAIFSRAEHLLKTKFGSDIYVVKVGDAEEDTLTKTSLAAFTDPCGAVPDYDNIIISDGNTRSDHARILKLPFSGTTTVTPGSYSTKANLLFRTVYGTEFLGNNAIKAVITDRNGMEQAATQPVNGAQFGGRALYYALSDQQGSQYSTTQNNVANNAMYVHLTKQDGNSIDSNNRLAIQFVQQNQRTVTPFETTVEASLTSVIDTSHHLHTLGIANELPITVWLKVYDMCSGHVTSTTEFSNYVSRIKYNLPVPPGNFRDINLSTGVKFNNGLHLRISQDYPYDNAYMNLGPDAGQVFVTGTYS